MKVKRFKEAVRYDAPNHRGFIGLRLQGFEPDGPKNQWVGISHFLPGGGAGPDSGFDYPNPHSVRKACQRWIMASQ
jgi:hypothetical protein